MPNGGQKTRQSAFGKMLNRLSVAVKESAGRRPQAAPAHEPSGAGHGRRGGV